MIDPAGNPEYLRELVSQINKNRINRITIFHPHVGKESIFIYIAFRNLKGV
jgi:hypothetical protein